MRLPLIFRWGATCDAARRQPEFEPCRGLNFTANLAASFRTWFAVKSSPQNAQLQRGRGPRRNPGRPLRRTHKQGPGKLDLMTKCFESREFFLVGAQDRIKSSQKER